MKKTIFIISLVFVSMLSQARTITKCGYFTEMFAMAGAVETVQSTLQNGQETALWTLTTFTQSPDGTWCFSMPTVPIGGPVSKHVQENSPLYLTWYNRIKKYIFLT